jgi:hypothetical protein
VTPSPSAPKPMQMDLVREAGLAEGVHLHLPEADYFQARALGSSDLPVLAKDPASWWYASDFNQARRARVKRSPALSFGSALHCRLLEGEEAFRERFVVEPDDADPGYARSVPEIRDLLIKAGRPEAARMFTKRELLDVARRAGLRHRVWDLAYAHYKHHQHLGRNHITQDEARRLEHMARLVEQHPDLGPGLRHGLTEVSVFWRRREDPDTLLRARFDKLQWGRIIDLKSMSNARGDEPEAAAYDAIGDHEYDLQAEHYREAREQAVGFIREGRIFSHGPDGRGGKVTPAEHDLLQAVAAAPSWVWVWIFYQVRSDDVGRERAPVIVPLWTEPHGELFDRARTVIDRALSNFRTYRDRHGLAEGWSEVRPVLKLPIERLYRLNAKRRLPE